MNVIGKIQGSKRPDEVIIYTAHWDHLGINMPDETGDSIYNGALDNASGVAGLIEIARAFNNMKKKPERTIVFLAVTAEEQGLLGSEYYAKNPVYPIEKTVADINIDGIGNYGVTKDIIIIGMGQSELEDYMKEIVEKEGGYITAERKPETGSYFRSDHFNFAKVGIPALFQGSGFDIPGKEKDYAQKFRDEHISKNYHRPSDEFDPAIWNMEGVVHNISLLFKLGKRLSFETTWPQWKESSEFKAIRDKQHVGGKG
jgi:Zn-dependent M28 family amino/carboxypeptidase